MPDSTRKDILDAYTAKLQGITVAAGYHRTIVTVAYEAKDWAEIDSTQRDWLGIVPQNETFEDYPGHVQSDWAIDIIAHLTPSAATADACMEAIVDMATDIRRALYTSPSNLGVDGVHYIKLVSRAGTESDPAAVTQGVASAVFKTVVRFEEALSAS